MTKGDTYYQILGVAEDADSNTIKRAYRKLAQQHHPDTNGGKGDEQFKSISEAYATLSNDKLRGAYDASLKGGYKTFDGGAENVDVEDLLGNIENLFGFGVPETARRANPHGTDIDADLHLAFRDAAMGLTTELKLTGAITCTTCKGTRTAPGATTTTCTHCNGTGIIMEHRSFLAVSGPCTQCDGTGIIPTKACATCGGRGIVNGTRSIGVTIPSGTRDGAVLRIRGKGEPGRNGGTPGDLYLHVHVEKDRIFGRDGDTLTLVVPVTFTEAALGTTVKIPTLTTPVTVRVPAGTNSGTTLRVKGHGITVKGRPTGDLRVIINVQMDAVTDEDARVLLTEYEKKYGKKRNLRAHLENVK